jgi:nucleoside-diphosphate-sugar epimerase
MSENILVVGGAGYIGGYLTDLLADNGYLVTVYDNLMYETRFLKPVSFVKGDIRDFKKLSELLPQYDVVIWLAAIVGDGACTVDPKLTQEVNSDTVKWLVQNYKGKIIFMSTCSVYGMNNDLLDEESPTNPLSTYALTKLDAEQYIVNNYDNYLIYRLGTLFGMGDNFSRIRLDLVTNVLAYKATVGEPLTVFGGEQWRPLLHVRDVATAVLHGLRHNTKGLFNLSNHNYTIRDIAVSVGMIIKNTQVTYTELPFEDLRNYKVKNEKIKLTGWRPLHTIRDGIFEMHNVIAGGRIVDANDPIYHNHNYLKTTWKPQN